MRSVLPNIDAEQAFEYLSPTSADDCRSTKKCIILPSAVWTAPLQTLQLFAHGDAQPV